MKGLLLKDFYMAAKYCKAVLLLVIVFLAASFLGEENIFFAVYPSIWYENCPLSILEAESCGTPVITGNYGGMKELVENNETGILINDINPENLKENIEKIYYDDNKISYMSKKCIEKRKNMISIKQYINKLEKLYATIYTIGEK